jgi:tRNA1(Val) A37 N6-methylase TrmN6
MRHTNINVITHDWISQVIKPTDIVIDATAGNGHDTLFLSQRSRHVFAFDVSELAISRTKEKTKQQNNVSLICDSHKDMETYIKESVDGIIYNCGYLPNSDHQSVTQVETTIASLDVAKNLLKDKGWLCITVYLGHAHGDEEATAVLSWLKRNMMIEKTYTYEGVSFAPIAYFARK